MTEHVSPPYKLPPEVLALLGDDATPERAAARQAAFLGACLAKGEIDEMPDVLALGAYDSALSAAAIRESVAIRVYESTRSFSDFQGWQAARQEFDALRNWRKA